MKKIDRAKLSSLPPHQQQLLVERMEQVAAYKRVNPLYFYNHPKLSAYPQHWKQLEFHSLTSIRTRALFGGNQSGKTTWGIADDLIQAVDIECLPDHLKPFKKWKPPFYCRIFTPDLQDTMNVVQDKVRDLVPLDQLKGGTWDRAYDKKDRVLRFKNGSYFQFMSYEQDLQKLGSATLHRIHYDEEPPKSIYEEQQPRLMRYGGDQIITMTPLQGLSWMHEGIWGRSGGDDDSPKWLFLNESENIASAVVDMDDNPTLTEEAKYETLKDYDAATRKARKEGRFVHFAGLIYSEFKDEKHVLHNYEEAPFKNKNVNVVVGIDPGLITCAVIWAAVNLNGEVHVFEELFMQNDNIAEVCNGIHRLNAKHGIEPVYNVIDPHARDRSKQTGRSDRSEFTEHGINTILGQNAVSAGISRVKVHLESGKLIIYGNCTNLIKEFKKYRWKEPKKRVEEDAVAEPIKKDDHGLDALRYIIMSRPYLPTEEVVDNRSEIEKIMDADQNRVERTYGQSEFGGVLKY